jgi:3-deoxy-D-manno-octulosonic-acid transferase
MFLLYSIFYSIGLIFLLPFEFFKRKKDLRKRWLKEKFGYFGELDTLDKKYIWIHAVSVGEVNASLPLVKKLREEYPDKEIVFSTITDTGQELATKKFSEGVYTVYLPFDLPFTLGRTLKKIKPLLLIIIETELWPNLIRVFKRNSVPVILLNGRMSDKSFKGYKTLSFFFKKVMNMVDFFGMQNVIYAERIEVFGIEPSKVFVLGNFKFDTQPVISLPEWVYTIKGMTIVAGSTHEGEEDLIIETYKRLKDDIVDLNLIIAPRHPERFKDVEKILISKKMDYIKRSEIESNDKEIKTGVIILLDTIGELSSVYGICDVALIGKSFKGYGGQNPLEPAFWGKAIVCGPHMENFPIIEEFYLEGAAIKATEERLYEILRTLLKRPEVIEQMGIKAKNLYQKNSGAVDKAMEILRRFIS